MIRAEQLRKDYGSFTAVNGIDLDIPAGEIYGFLGPNGAGKTTTIMMLLGVTQPTSGDIYLFGERYDPKRFKLRKRIGVVPEKHPFGMWRWMTVYDYLTFFADLFECRKPAARIRSLLARVELPEVAGKRLAELSRGMLQKVSFVRALLPDPDMLFLDEPISGLDPIGIKQIRDLILMENREGRTIFISSHLLSEMERLCDRVAIINQGRIVAQDAMESLLDVSGDREYGIDLEAIPDDLITAVRDLPFVKEATSADTTLVVRVDSTGDYRKELSQYLYKRDLVPLRFQEKEASLEDVFVTITAENVEDIARRGADQ